MLPPLPVDPQYGGCQPASRNVIFQELCYIGGSNSMEDTVMETEATDLKDSSSSFPVSRVSPPGGWCRGGWAITPPSSGGKRHSNSDSPSFRPHNSWCWSLSLVDGEDNLITSEEDLIPCQRCSYNVDVDGRGHEGASYHQFFYFCPTNVLEN